MVPLYMSKLPFLWALMFPKTTRDARFKTEDWKTGRSLFSLVWRSSTHGFLKECQICIVWPQDTQFYTLRQAILNELWPREDTSVSESCSHVVLICMIVCGWHNKLCLQMMMKYCWAHTVMSITGAGPEAGGPRVLCFSYVPSQILSIILCTD